MLQPLNDVAGLVNLAKGIVDLVDYAERVEHQRVMELRFDDNLVRCIEQQVRLYQSGRLSKTGLLRAIDSLLPEESHAITRR